MKTSIGSSPIDWTLSVLFEVKCLAYWSIAAIQYTPPLSTDVSRQWRSRNHVTGEECGNELETTTKCVFFVRKSIRALHQSTADLSLCASEQMFGFLIMQHLGFLTRAYDTITRPLFTPNPKYFAKHTELHGVLTCVSFRHVTKLPSCNLQKWLLLISFIILKWLQECVCVCAKDKNVKSHRILR